jgi:hypothetical protein
VAKVWRVVRKAVGIPQTFEMSIGRILGCARRMSYHSLRSVRLVAVIGMLLCYGCTSSNPSEPTATTVSSVTDVFSGSLAQKGALTHSFNVATTGSVEVKLTAVDPLASIALGVAVLTTSCGNTIVKNDNVRVGTAALTGTATAGGYCLQVYDSGNIADGMAMNYTIQVTHP